MHTINIIQYKWDLKYNVFRSSCDLKIKINKENELLHGLRHAPHGARKPVYI